jgi:transposase
VLQQTLDASRRLQRHWSARRILPPEELRRLRELVGELRFLAAQLTRLSYQRPEDRRSVASAAAILDEAIRVASGLQRSFDAAQRTDRPRLHHEQIELDLHELERARHRYAALARL